MPFLLIPLYALSDRFTGGGWPKLDAMLPGRSLFWACLVLIGAGYLVGGVYGASVAVGWGIYRSLDFGFLGSSIDPRTPAAIAGTFVRHVIFAAPLALIAYWTGRDWHHAGLLGIGYAVAATALGAWFGQRNAAHEAAGEPGGNENAFVETARGAFAGLAVALALT